METVHLFIQRFVHFIFIIMTSSDDRRLPCRRALLAITLTPIQKVARNTRKRFFFVDEIFHAVFVARVEHGNADGGGS